MNYKLNEIFYSIQGEGLNAGMSAIFIRLSGCNINCDFCDTDHSLKMRLTELEILKTVQTYPCFNIIITGGEPLLQDLKPLVKLLQDEGYMVGVETNGTFATDIRFDWITVSPKGDNLDEILLMECDELKVVYMGQDLTPYDEHIDCLYKFLQPLDKDGKMNIEETISAVKRSRGDWRLSVQLHKLLGVK